MRYRIKTGMAYPTDAAVDDALRQLAQQADEASRHADASGDPRDLDAAATAELARKDALKFCFENGLAREVVPGDEVDDLPAGSIGWLRDQGHIEPIADTISEEVWRDLGRPDDADFEEGRA